MDQKQEDSSSRVPAIVLQSYMPRVSRETLVLHFVLQTGNALA